MDQPADQMTPQELRQRQMKYSEEFSKARELYKKFLARGNTKEEARALTINVYPNAVMMK